MISFLNTAFLLLLGLTLTHAAAPQFDAGLRDQMISALASIREDQPANRQIGPKLTCTDADGDRVNIRVDVGKNLVQINFLGQLSLTGQVDYESQEIQKENNLLKIQIVCEEVNMVDPQKDIIEAVLSVQDINDNRPEFNKTGDTAYYVVIPENTPTGTMIYNQIIVVDKDGPDNNIIEALCIEECDLFSVRSVQIGNGVYKFEIRTKGSVKGGKTAYTMVISAKDAPRTGEAPLESSKTHKVVIPIQDIQDLPPAFSFLPFNLYMTENHALNTALNKRVGAFDQDKGDPNDIELILFAHPDDPDTFNNGYFSLGPQNEQQLGRDNITVASLILQKPIDREAITNTGKILKLRIMAMEKIPPHLVDDENRIHNPMNATEEIRITVGDVNDVPPVFNMQFYNITFPERVTDRDRNRWHQISNNIQIIIADEDGEGNNEFEVAIVSGNSDNMFVLDKYAGVGSEEFTISAWGGILDFELPNNGIRRLTLVATDKGRPDLTSTAEVLVVPTNENDYYPKFGDTSYVFSINEGDYRNNPKYVGQVQATDEDLGELGRIVSYTFDDQANLNTFSIDNNGMIMAIANIDYDAGSTSFSMTVTAADGGRPGVDQRRSSVPVTVLITNVPDVGPRFLQDSYITYITEDETELRPKIRVQAVDPEGVSQIAYSLDSTSPPLPGYFSINPTNGSLTVYRKIDYKDTRDPTRNSSGTVIVKVRACTTGGNEQLCALTNVLVHVTDLNNYPPVFVPSAVYNVSLSENAKPGDEVVQLFTTDRDAETDPTSGNAKVQYAIESGNRDAFTIEIDSGIIKVNSRGDDTSLNNLDFDDYPQYRLLVVARDDGNPTLSSTATVYIYLKDANNKQPQFLEQTFFFSVKDDAQIGTPIGTVSARDPDSMAIIRYSLDFTNLYVELKGEKKTNTDSILPARNALAIDEVSGMLKVAGPLDRNLYEVINFGVIANDVNINISTQAEQRATAFVILTVLGSDDVRPYYIAPGWSRENPIIRLTRPETTGNQTLYSLTAFDPKTSEQISRFEKIPGSDDGDFFAVRGMGTYGIVYVIQGLNYDYEPNMPPPQRELQVGVRAFAPDGVRYVDATIILTVTDVNDHAPEFTQSSYVFYVEENSRFTTSVGSVYANDVDSGSFGDLRYSLEGPNSGDFIVITDEESLQATIYVNKDATIDYETNNLYTLYITATDNPERPGEVRPSNEQQRSTRPVFIYVLDKNDNDPICSQGVYEFTVIGTKPIGDLVDRVKATDDDEGENGDLVYTISPLTDRNATFYFDIETRLEGTVRPEKVGRITVKNSLRSLPDDSTFRLKVVVSDKGGEEVRRGYCDAIIRVSKGVIDPKPRWTPGLKSKINVPEETYPYSVANITASPANVSSAVVYSFIKQGNVEGDYTKFNIDPHTGHVTLKEKLDYETQDSYNLRIQATDVSNDTLTNSFLLAVLVIDIDDNVPAFNTCAEAYPIPVPVSVREDEPIGTYVYTAIACDLDSIEHNQMEYNWFIDDPNVYGDKLYCKQDEMSSFKINSATGVITTNKKLDREAKPDHLLCVMVEKLGRRKRSRVGDLQARKNHHQVLYILVTILDANDEGPKFVEDPIYKVILEYPGSYGSYAVGQAIAVDKDIYPNNRIRYSIDSILYTKRGKQYEAPQAFNINSGDGTIAFGSYDYSDYAGGYFNITVRAQDLKGEFNETDTMTFVVYVGRSAQQIRVVFEQPADGTVNSKAKNMIDELNGIKESGVYYEIKSIGPHIVSNADNPVFAKTDVCLVIVKNTVVMNSLDAVKKLSDEQLAQDILRKYGAVEPGPCEPARSVYPEGWESYWWVLVAFAIFIFVITLILIIIVIFLYRGYRNYMDSQRTYLVTN